MKITRWGQWDWRNFFSLGLSFYVGPGYLSISTMLGPWMGEVRFEGK